MICSLKSNGSRGCGGMMLPGRFYTATDFGTQEGLEAASLVSYHCPTCGNHVDPVIEANRRTHQFLPVLIPATPTPAPSSWDQLTPETPDEAADLAVIQDAFPDVLVYGEVA